MIIDRVEKKYYNEDYLIYFMNISVLFGYLWLFLLQHSVNSALRCSEVMHVSSMHVLTGVST